MVCRSRRFVARAIVAAAALAPFACMPGKGAPPGIVDLDLSAPEVLDRLVFTDAAAWRVARDEDVPALELFGASDYQPPFRSPLNIALLREWEFDSFTLDVELKQTGRAYGHRDLCLFFGVQSAQRFYYVHLATTPDANAHNVFLVDGAARRNLLSPQAHGVDWGDRWHHVRLERDVDTGSIRVFFDDLKQPILEVVDRTLLRGRVGVGSFDDTGRFRAWSILGEKTHAAHAQFIFPH